MTPRRAVRLWNCPLFAVHCPLSSLTRRSPRVSYLSRQSFGIRRESARGDRRAFRFCRRGSRGMLCRTGSRRQLGCNWVWARDGISLPGGASRTLLPPPGPDRVNGPGQSGPFPETNFWRGSGKQPDMPVPWRALEHCGPGRVAGLARGTVNVLDGETRRRRESAGSDSHVQTGQECRSPTDRSAAEGRSPIAVRHGDGAPPQGAV